MLSVLGVISGRQVMDERSVEVPKEERAVAKTGQGAQHPGNEIS